MHAGQFWSFSIMGKLICEKNENVKLQSNFSIAFENIGRQKLDYFLKQERVEKQNKINEILRYSTSMIDI